MFFFQNKFSFKFTLDNILLSKFCILMFMAFWIMHTHVHALIKSLELASSFSFSRIGCRSGKTGSEALIMTVRYSWFLLLCFNYLNLLHLIRKIPLVSLLNVDITPVQLILKESSFCWMKNVHQGRWTFNLSKKIQGYWPSGPNIFMR